MYTLLSYVITVASAIGVGLLIRLPLLPERPMRHSWTVSALFPTPIISLGLLAIFFKLGISGFYHGLDLALFLGILSALFVKYLFDGVFPKPAMGESDE
ncbi:energy-converting hydrogenase A subunit A EhaA [Methanobacterium alcaliphilum]|uniref:energy-converting hydrogenase A subunit A EhaA n=1 Tax=Methanobacterium alcaliphilum TaxID=392018 RepID=UPI00200B3852|nr:energy-converting hydrogenase A subunit A EhaA [Methanobacterium alcaliphilum]